VTVEIKEETLLCTAENRGIIEVPGVCGR